ncbi:MAG TPA: patatin-like phospholipase family protein [Chthoniobacterales bacterium]|nr:patatin-like phospholipase family protein [Chthoniobacterales bacterium]
MDAPRKTNKSENVSLPGAVGSGGNEKTARLEFKDLVLRENDLLFVADKISEKDRRPPSTEPSGPAGEPWVSYAPVDRVGLAFSGGGIRSATFNLGVLKGLHDLKVLKHVDYLSTVSGGGYIGAWWTAWRARVGKKFPTEDLREFPIAHRTDADAKGDPDEKLNREPEEVRHLREFSNFLSPRIGFFQSEMWNAVMAVLSAVLPAVMVASSVLALAFLIWLGVNRVILADALPILMLPRGLRWLSAPLLLSLITLVAYIAFEIKWRREGKAEPLPTKEWRTRVSRFHFVLVVLFLAGICSGWHYWLKQVSWMSEMPLGLGSEQLWKWSTGISIPESERAFSFSSHLFDAPVLCFAIALVLLILRLLIMRIRKVSISGTMVSLMDRALSRMIGTALVFAALGILWLAGCWLNYTKWGTQVPAGGALVSGGAFALLRNWIGRMGPAKKGGVMDIVKPLIPQILAYVAIALWAICIAALIARGIEKYHVSPWLLFAIALGIVLFAAVSFDPAQVSMHSFYRNRLSRAYLGASNPDANQSAEQNRQTDVRVKDDIQLRDLSPEGAQRPIHLVCCAANDLGGDHLENLSRGSRSAVLSRFGFAIGNYCHTWDKEADAGDESLGLGSAITASAAAFNSNMGSLSMTLGAGVTFLCTALNLRLGLWLPHPLTDKDGVPKVFPGLLFFKEMFGLTNSGLRPAGATSQRKPVAKHVHLSDGAHFENLALYELVRRHCRYIIVSDCGADPEVAFDDFGNAMRRIREDFGVEIDIDLSPLKPNEARLSKQHVAVGSITYDPRGDQKDTAVLLYLKPTLTGDEPGDITQYRTRNEDFPHESTGDQFYDEAQWESYRCLGEHAARSALQFVEREGLSDSLSPEAFKDAVFNGARWEWYQSSERLKEKFVELTGRLTALEAELRKQGPEKFVREMFPELQTISANPGSNTRMNSEEMIRALHFLVQIIQLMEDVWLNCDLDTQFNDPNNLGWMNSFQRWAYTPTFRLWWPLLKSMYGSKFRRFMEERLDLKDEDYPVTIGEVTSDQIDPEGLAMIYWTRMYGSVPNAGKAVYIYKLHLPLQTARGDTGDVYTIQAGLAFVDLQTAGLARWNSDEFFVPPGLWGAGIGGKFLDALLRKLPPTVTTCEVILDAEHVGTSQAPIGTDIASRQERNDLIAFYKRDGFKLNAENRLVRGLEDIRQESSPRPRPHEPGR